MKGIHSHPKKIYDDRFSRNLSLKSMYIFIKMNKIELLQKGRKFPAELLRDLNLSRIKNRFKHVF